MKDPKKLKTGYTTGSCAAAAAKAAAGMLLSGEEIRHTALMTPKQVCLYLDVERITRGADFVSCAVKKDSGDDPDVTNGVYVYAKISRTPEPGIFLDGGEGIGRVTKKGLQQNIGEAAINKVPRRMIREAVMEQKKKYGYEGGLSVVISIPEGKELAAKTFNPRLGIEGGISVLGTSGIVEPMSEKALTDTIYLEMKVLKESGADWCFVVPGNYGSDFLRRTLQFDSSLAVKCSNYIGEAVDSAGIVQMKGILLAGHIGKLVKVAAGVMNTHSRQADCRMEVLASHAAAAGAGRETVRKIMGCTTTVQALGILKEKALLEPVMKTVTARIGFHLKQRAAETLQTGAVVFSLEDGVLGYTDEAQELVEKICGQ